MPEREKDVRQQAAKKAAAAVVDKLNREYGEGTVLLGSDMRFQSIPRISSGVYELDVALGGGWPRGRLVQIYGPESSGKSFLAYLAARTASRHCHWCSMLLAKCSCGAKDPIATAWVDLESTHDSAWAAKIGVDLDLFYVVKPENGAHMVDQVDLLLRSGEVGLIVIDSIAAITPAENLEKSAEDGMSPGAVARLMSLATKKWQAALNKKLPHPVQRQKVDGKQVPVMWDNLCTVMALNQLRESIARVPLPPAPPGGRAARHAWSVSLALSFGNSDIEWDEEDKGEQSAVRQTVHFLTYKNKTYPPKKSGQFTIRFADASVDNAAQVVRLARRLGLVTVSGSWWSYGDMKAQGEEAFAEMLSDSKMILKLKAEVDAKVFGEEGGARK